MLALAVSIRLNTAALASAPLVDVENSQFRLLCATEHNRRNWLFTNTVQGAQTSAALYSLIETAKLNNLNPYEYFNYLLSSLSEIDINDEEALDNYMPWSKELPDNTYLTKKS